MGVRVTASVPVQRGGQEVDLLITREEDGKLYGFVPAVSRLSRCEFELTDPEKLADALEYLMRSAEAGAVPTTQDLGIHSGQIPGQTDLVSEIANGKVG